jgi:hypothetical protein
MQFLSNQSIIKDSSLQINLVANQNQQFTYAFKVPASQTYSQPYWLVQPKTEGMFVVQDQTMIGKAENDAPFSVGFTYKIEGQEFSKQFPVQYKYLDLTKGDVYQPIVVLPKKEVAPIKSVVLMPTNSNAPLPAFEKGIFHKTIQYDHIPAQTYFQDASIQVVKVDIKKQGQKVGYVDGAGDAIPEALEQLGYEVVYLKEADLTTVHLKGLDAICMRTYPISKLY